MAKRIPLVAIVGRTNVGKSTLFNAIARRKISIVEDLPGVTRDRVYTYVNHFGAPFSLIDTGGLAGEQEKSLATSVRLQTSIAIQESDLVICVFDGVQGVHPYDEEVVKLLRASEKPILWVVNKCESPTVAQLSGDFYKLGIDEPFPVSAAHHQGVKELVAKIKQSLNLKDPTPEESEQPREKLPIRVAIIGKPNVGKSTLVNKIVGEERVIASPLAGTTRDAVDIRIRRDGRDFTVVDTAGLRKKHRVEDLTVERFGNLRALKALVGSDVAVLILDATQGMPTEQDAKIGGLVHERGRGLVIVVNKWDAIEKDHRSVKQYKDAVQHVFKFAPYAPILFVSALTGRRCPSVLQKVAEVFDKAQTRIKTSDLNRVLNYACARRPPPVYHGEPVKLFFATQVEVAPPTCVLFVNHPKRLGFAYERYLKNILRDQFKLEGSDIKLIFRKRLSKDQRAIDEREGTRAG